MWIVLALLVNLLSFTLEAQTAGVPKEKIPDLLLNQVRLLEADFVIALQKDCGGNGCFPRGCVYASHQMITMPGNRSLPGLSSGADDRDQSEPQYILTGVTCEYTFESSLDQAGIKNLSRRLEAKLSKGALRVSLKALEIPAAANQPLPIQPLELSLMDKIASQLLQHFSWILGVILANILLILGLWAWRRIGYDSKEDELRFMLYKQKLEADAVIQAPILQADDPERTALQIRQTELTNRHDMNPGILQARLQLWLEEGAFQKVAYSLLILAKAQYSPLGAGSKSSLLSLQFSEFMQHFNPAGEDKRVIFQELEQEVMIKNHFDQSMILKVRQLFHNYDLKTLALRSESLEAKRALLALAPGIKKRDLVNAFDTRDLMPLAESFWDSNRVSTAAICHWLNESAEGTQGSSQDCQAILILGFICSRLSIEQRLQLNNRPNQVWCDRVFYPEQLPELPIEAAKNLLLSVDALALNHWYEFLSQDQQAIVWNLLPPSYQAQQQGLRPSRVDSSLVLATINTYGQEYVRLRQRGI